jgi:hypothetical protein
MRGDRPSIRWSVALLLVAIGAGTLFADAVDDSIFAIRAYLKQGESPKAVEAMSKLASTDDPRVTACFVDLTSSEVETVAVAAYPVAARHKDPAFVAKLRARADKDELAKAHPAIYSAVLEAMETYGKEFGLDRACRGVLEGVVQRNLPISSDFSTRAVRAYATFQDKEAFERLLRWLGETESVTGFTGTTTKAFPLSPEARQQYEKTHAQILASLEGLAGGQKCADFKAWTEWWKANKTYKFAK